MKITAFFWDLSSFTLAEIYGYFRDAYCLHLQGDDGGSKHT
jgi:hypothetical protein